jgi:hypothetical protein
VYAASNVPSERFGPYCSRQGVLSPEDLVEVNRLAKEKNLRTADTMVQLGLITLDRRGELLEGQVRGIIWSVLTWKEGQYRLTNTRPKRTDLVKISIFPGDLILQGAARTGSLASLRAMMPPERRLFPATGGPFELYELTLTNAQARLVAHADGTKTVTDLLALTDMPEHETLATLVGLEWTGQLAERPLEPLRKSRVSYGL